MRGNSGRWALAAALAGAVIGTTGARGQDDGGKIAFPADYRSWTHVKSMIILPGHPLADPFKGIHHVYANDTAAAGFATGQFADGSVLVFDLLEAVSGGDAIAEGPRVLVGVMAKSAGEYAATDGWGYEGFAGDSTTERLVSDAAAQCHGCHAGTAATGYVFSGLRK